MQVTLLLTAPRWRGSATSFLKIARGLMQAGHDVRVVAASQEVVAGFVGAGVACIPVRLENSGIASAWRLRRELGRRPPAVIIADSPRDVRLAMLATFGEFVRVYWRFNLPNRKVPDDPLARWLFGRLAGVVCQSAFAEKLVTQGAPWLGGVPRTRIANGYDMAELPVSAERGAAFRSEWGIAEDVPLVVTVGALSPEKEVPTAIAATDAARAAFPGLLHLIVGDGQDEGVLRANAPRHVRFLGALDATGTADAMRAADIVLLPSAREIFPNVVAESMALGCAVVTVQGGAAPELAGNAAVLVAPGDSAAMAEALAALLQDPERRNALGREARARVEECFGLERMEVGYGKLVGI